PQAEDQLRRARPGPAGSTGSEGRDRLHHHQVADTQHCGTTVLSGRWCRSQLKYSARRLGPWSRARRPPCAILLALVPPLSVRTLWVNYGSTAVRRSAGSSAEQRGTREPDDYVP